jgi:hypothetical protein
MYTINKGVMWERSNDLLIKHRQSRLVTPWLATFFIFEGLSRVRERDKMVKKQAGKFGSILGWKVPPKNC